MLGEHVSPLIGSQDVVPNLVRGLLIESSFSLCLNHLLEEARINSTYNIDQELS